MCASSLRLTRSLPTFQTFPGPPLHLSLPDCFLKRVIVNFIERILVVNAERKHVSWARSLSFRCSLRSFLCVPMWRSKVKGTQLTTRLEVDKVDKTFEIDQFEASQGWVSCQMGVQHWGVGGWLEGPSVNHTSWRMVPCVMSQRRIQNSILDNRKTIATSPG